MALQLTVYFEKYMRRRVFEYLAPQQSLFACADKNLYRCLKCGIGFHHAGMDSSDKQLVEFLLKQKQLHTIVSTTTLSQGVDFDIDRVIIFGTKQVVDGQLRSYQYQDVIQMIGRAGRRSGKGTLKVVSDQVGPGMNDC